jgi:hypothetical protein
MAPTALRFSYLTAVVIRSILGCRHRVSTAVTFGVFSIAYWRPVVLMRKPKSPYAKNRNLDPLGGQHLLCVVHHLG